MPDRLYDQDKASHTPRGAYQEQIYKETLTEKSLITKQTNKDETNNVN